MAIKKGRALTLLWESTKVGNITSLSLSVDGETINITNFDSGSWNDYLAGDKDWTMDITAHNDPEGDAQQDAMEVAMFTNDPSGAVTFGPETPTTGDITFSGNVKMTNFSVDASGANDVVETSFSLQGNGQLTRNVTA